jgi:hypothetical protein
MNNTAEQTRTWTAKITVRQNSADRGEVIDADLPAPRYAEGFMGFPDLLRETEREALRQAAEYVREGFGSEASVEIFKTTKARGTEYDRPGGHAYRDGDQVVAYRWGR